MEKQRLKTSFFSILLAIFGAFFLHSETYYWVGEDDKWNIYSNWNTQSGGTGVPSNGDDVIINQSVSITIDSDVTIKSLKNSGADITIVAEHTLEITGEIENGGNLTVNGTLEASNVSSFSLGGDSDVKIDGSGQIVAKKSAFTGTNLLIGSSIKITETADSVVSGAFSVKNSKPDEGETKDNYRAVYENGWNFPFSGSYVWTGEYDSEPTKWEKNTNWADGATFLPVSNYPNAQDAVVTIPSEPPNQPVVTEDISVKNLEVKSGASLTLNTGKFSLYSQYSGDGTLKFISCELDIAHGLDIAIKKLEISDTADFDYIDDVGTGEVNVTISEITGTGSQTLENHLNMTVPSCALGKLILGENSKFSPADDSTLTITDTWDNSAGGTFSHNKSAVIFGLDSSSSTKILGSEKQDFYNFTVIGAIETDNSLSITGNADFSDCTGITFSSSDNKITAGTVGESHSFSSNEDVEFKVLELKGTSDLSGTLVLDTLSAEKIASSETIRFNSAASSISYSDSDSVLNNIEIASSATLLLQNDITVSGDWTNNNTSDNGLSASGKTVTFTGENATISGDSTFAKAIFMESATLGGSNDFTDFVCEKGGISLTFAGGTTQTLSGMLSLKGNADNLLTLKSDSESTIVVPAANTSADYLSIGENVFIKEGSDVKKGSHTAYTTENSSKPSEGAEPTDYITLYKHGWNLGYDFVFTWRGEDSASHDSWAIAANWDLGIVPGLASENTAGVKVVIPDGCAYYPILQSDDVSLKNLVIGTETASSHTALLTIDNAAGLPLTNTDDSVETLTNYGTIEYKGDSRITDGTKQINDASNDGTVRYSGGTDASPLNLTDFNTTGADYANLEITGVVSQSSGIEVSGTTDIKIASNAEITLSEANVFGGVVTIERGKSVLLSGENTFSAGVKAEATDSEISKLTLHSASETSFEFDGKSYGITLADTIYESSSVTTKGKVSLSPTENSDKIGGLSIEGGTTTLSGGTTLSSVSISAGAVLQAGSASTDSHEITVEVDWSNESGASGFVANESKVIFAGSEAQISGENKFYAAIFMNDTAISGSNTFTDFTCEKAGTTLTFAGGTTQKVSGNFTLKGDSENLVTITGDSEWKFSPDYVEKISLKYAKIANSKNMRTDPIIVYAKNGYNEDGGGNTNWIFAGQEYEWTGATDTDWDEPSNWSPSSVPQKYSVVTIPRVGNENYPILSDLTDGVDLSNDTKTFDFDVDGDGENEQVVSSIKIEENAVFDFAGKKLTVNTLLNSGKIRVLGTEDLSAITKKSDVTADGIIDYHGSFGAALIWGNDYHKLEFSDGAAGTVSEAISVAETTLIANGEGNTLKLLSSANAFQSGVKIGFGDEKGGDVTISGSDLKINADAQCSSITVNSAAQIENGVKTTGAQTYKGDVSFLADSTLHVENDAKITFLGDVGKSDARHSLKIEGETIFEKGGTSAENPQNVFASSVAFTKSVDGTAHLFVNASDSIHFFEKIGSATPLSSLVVHDADSVLFSGIGEGENAGVSGDVFVLAEKIELKSASYVSGGKQEFSGNVSVFSFEDGTWSGSEISVLQNLSFLFSEKKMTLKSPLSVLGDFLFDSGQFGFSGQKIDSQKNVIVFGEKYSPTDSNFSDSNSRFSFPERSPSEKNAVFLDLSDATLSVKGVFYANGVDLDGGTGFFTLSLPKNDGSKVSFNSSASFGENQWGENWAAVFNCSVKNVHVEGQVGNAFVSASSSQGVRDAGGNYSVSYENGDSLKIVCDGADVSGATGAFQFDSPKIEKAYTVYDDVLCVIFNIPVENSNKEVYSAALLSSSLSSGGLWISDGSASVSSGAFLDADCTTPFLSDSAKTVYFKSANRWNTDATGKSAGESESSDSLGVHQNVKVDISALSGLFAARHGHTHSLPFGSAGEPSFSDTEDHCRPVLIASYTGQEVHDATLSSQKDYDAHNFLEFQYSEAVDIADMTSALGGSNFRAGEENRRGALKSQSGDFPFFSDGFAEFSRGNIRAGHKIRTGEAWSGEIDSEKPHAFYRQFKKNASSAEEVQSHRIRLSVAGYVLSESAGEKNWAGYIENAICPYSPLLQTKIRSLENEYIVDKAQRADGEKNAILSHSESSATQNHVQKELFLNALPSVSRTLAPDFYCAWDTSAPVFAPYVDSTDAWTSGGKKNAAGESTHELVGTVRSATNPYIEKIELHLFDGEPDYSDASRMWLVRTGWVNSADTKTPLKGQTGAAPEAIGGSRDKLGSFSSFTDGGIRKSSLYGAEAAFEYMYKLDGKTSDWRSVGETGILQSVSSPIFRNDEYYQTTQTSDDGLYFSVPLSSDDLSLGLPSRTTFSIRYNTETGFITDLAGNRLLESDEGSQKKTVRSLDITPPTFALTLAPISHNKIYAVFTKTLAWNGVRLGSLSAQDWSDLAQNIQDNLIFVKSESDDVNTLDFPSEEIFVTGVEIALETDDSTALLLTLSRNVTLSDVEDLWIKVSGGEDTTNIFGEMVKMPYLRDSAGNCVLDNTCHALSDFALNAVNTLYAYAEDDSVDGDEWIEQGLYGTNVTDSLSKDYAVHDFSENSGNYGTLKSGKDITFRLQFTGGVSASGEAVAPSSGEECEMVLFPSSRVLSSWLGDKLTRLTGKSWRVWLTTELDSYATLWNDTGETVSVPPVPSEESPLFYDAILKNDEFHFNAGNEWQFIFKIKKGDSEITLNHDGDTNTPRVPLYALWMPESKIAAGDFSFVDLWSFKIAGTKNQRGGVSILNNVIDATVREKTVIKVDLPSDGQLNVFVLTLDGGVVARLSRGKKSAGTHYFYWDGTNGAGKEVARGLYFVRVSGSGIDETRKVLVIK